MHVIIKFHEYIPLYSNISENYSFFMINFKKKRFVKKKKKRSLFGTPKNTMKKILGVLYNYLAHLTTIPGLWSLSSHTNLLLTIQFGAISFFFSKSLLIYSLRFSYIVSLMQIYGLSYSRKLRQYIGIKKETKVSLLEWLLACFKGNIYSLSFYCRLSTIILSLSYLKY